MAVDPDTYQAIEAAARITRQEVGAEVSEVRRQLSAHQGEVWEIIRGKAGTNGLVGRVRIMERDLYRDPQTNSPGIVSQVKKIQLLLYLVGISIAQNVPDTVNWIIKFIGGLQ